MSDLYDQIVSQRGSAERLLARIPGFRGYIDKGTRRTSDRMLRDHIADSLSQRIDRLAQIQRDMVDSGGLQYMSKTRSVVSKLQVFRDRVKGAAPGYSGFNEAVKVGAEELERLYSFDEAMIRYTDRFDEGLNVLEQAAQSNQGVNEAIASLDKLAAEANEAFSLREDVLTNLSKSLS
jgi:hypothetical protein